MKYMDSLDDFEISIHEFMNSDAMFMSYDTFNVTISPENDAHVPSPGCYKLCCLHLNIHDADGDELYILDIFISLGISENIFWGVLNRLAKEVVTVYPCDLWESQ